MKQASFILDFKFFRIFIVNNRYTFWFPRLHVAGLNAKRRDLLLSCCQMVVLNEGEKLLSENLIATVEKLLAFMSSRRQLLMFFSTFPVTAKQFKDKHMLEVSFLFI
jgi:hypothetical protein